MKKPSRKKSAYSSLCLHALELSLNIGVTKAERVKKQPILLGISLFFKTPPAAIDSDDIEDTICYGTLIELIHEQLKERAFHLVEHLAKTIHAIIKTYVSKDTGILVDITKFPKIRSLKGGISFNYGDTLPK